MHRNVQPLPMCSLGVQALNASVSLIVICIIFCPPSLFRLNTHTTDSQETEMAQSSHEYCIGPKVTPYSFVFFVAT